RVRTDAGGSAADLRWPDESHAHAQLAEGPGLPGVPREVRMDKTRQGLAIIFSDSAHGRLHAGLSLACASAALGRPVRMFFHSESVSAFDQHRKWKGDQV